VKLLQRVPIWLTGLTLIGAAFAWVMALFSGFSASNVICWGARSVGSCEISSSPYWTARTVLWLAPLVIILILGMWALVFTFIPKSSPQVVISLLMIVFYILLAIFVISQAAGNTF
jgi:hypothetical protein